MLKDVRVHGAITGEIDFYANLAGEKLLAAPFYESGEMDGGEGITFFLGGMYLRLTQEGVGFSGTGGLVSEYMFGSPMPLVDLGHKEVKNRLVLFGAVAGDKGLSFTSQLSGAMSYENLFLDGNALGNYFFLVKVPWPFSPRRIQQTLLKRLGRGLKRSRNPGQGADSYLADEILKELSEPDATLLLLRLVHRPNQQFHQFAREYYLRQREWGAEQAEFAARMAAEVGVKDYQRERLAIDIVYKDHEHRQIVDEYKDILLSIHAGRADFSAPARLNTLRNLATRHRLPRSLFDTLDGLIPASMATREGEPESLRQTREIFEGLFLSSKPPEEVIGAAEIVRLLQCKQEAQHHRDKGFEQVLLDTGRMLDERAAKEDALAALEVFSNVVTFFDRLDNAEALFNQLAFMEQAEIDENRVRSTLGNKRAFDSLEEGLFFRLVAEPFLKNPYSLRVGRRKILVLCEGLDHLEKGETTLAQIATQVNEIANGEKAVREIYVGIRSHLKRFYFNLSNPTHIKLLQREVEGELRRHSPEGMSLPESAFAEALEEVRKESEYLNSVLPRLEEPEGQNLMMAFLRDSGLDLYRIEELEREYREGRFTGAPETPQISREE